MATIEIPNVRQESTVLMPTTLKDNGVAVDWSGLQNIKAYMYSDAQRVIAGKCDVEVDGEDATVLKVTYAATRPQYLGVNSLLVRCKYHGREKSYDVPVLNFVERTAQATGVTVLDDPVIDVEIEVDEVSTSLLDGAIAAAQDAAVKAEEAAALVPLQVLEDCVEATENAETATAAANEAAAAARAAGIASVEASIADDEPGTPSAEATLLNKVLSLVFHHLKGDKGDKGNTGATPDISIGAVTTGAPGTPVVITMTGTAEAPVLNITIPQGLKGDQGNSGSSVEFPYELVNNLTTNDPTKGLSAAQGVVLDGKISQLDQKVDGKKLTSTNVANGDVYGYTIADYRISGAGVWVSPGKTVFIPKADIVDSLVIVPADTTHSYKYAFVKSTSVTASTKPDYCTGETMHEVLAVTTTLKKEYFPSDCVYVAVVFKQTNNDPYAVTYAQISPSLSDRISGVSADMAALDDKVGFSETGAEIIANTDGKYLVADGKRIAGTGKWANAGKAYFYPVTEFTELLRIFPDSAVADTYKYAFLKTIGSLTSGMTADFCTGESNAHEVANNIVTTIKRSDIPADCRYIYISLQNAVAATIVALVCVNLESDIQDLSERVAAIENDKGAHPYYGERINLRGFVTRKYDSEVMTDSITDGGTTVYGQGGAVFGNLAFRLYGRGVCIVFNIADYDNITSVSQFDLGSKGASNHVNCCKFGNVLSDTDFPYLYVAGLYNGKCFVEKVSENGSTLVQTITISGVEGNITVGNDGKLWLFYGDNLGSTMYFYKFNLPNPGAGDVTLTLADAIDSWTDTDCAEFLAYYYQGGMIYNGRLYVLFGQTGSSQKRYMTVYDIDTHRRVSVVDFTDTIEKELEDCDVRNGRLVVFTNGGNGLNVVEFI